MPDEFPQMDYLGDSPEGELQYKPDNSGVQRVSNQTQDDRPSLAGVTPRYGHSGQVGLGGTMVSDELSKSVQGRQTEHGPHVKDVDLTPEAMLAASKRLEDEFLERQAHLDGSTAVDPALIRSGGAQSAYNPHQQAPDWLQKYMESQPFTDPYHQPPMSPVDRIKNNRYLTEQEKLRMLRDQHRSQGLK